MDEKLRVFFWILGGAGFFALLGAGFGALTGAVTRLNGRAAGSVIGGAVAEGLARMSNRKFSDVTLGVLIGAVDGAFFLAILGGLAGAGAGYHGAVEPQLVVAVCCGAVLLAVGAASFGLLAYGLARAGVWALGGVFSGAILGAILGARLGNSDTLLYGTAVGALLGIFLGIATNPESLKAKRSSQQHDTEDEEPFS